MHRAAVLEVADHCDGDVVKRGAEIQDGEEVEQGLSGVLADAVARAYHNRPAADLVGELIQIVRRKQ